MTSTPSESEFLLSRQPIVSPERRLVGWGLDLATVDGHPLASDGEHGPAPIDALLRLGAQIEWDSLLCGVPGLVSMDRRMLFASRIDELPCNRLWLGVAPCDEVDGALSNRLHELHARHGARLALLAYRRRDPRECLATLAAAVEIDAYSGATEARDALVRRAHRRRLPVLSRGIDRDEDLVSLRGVGFDLMQGRIHATPSLGGETLANAQGRMLLELLVESRGDLEVEEVARRFEANPELAVALLRLVNGLELARAQRIDSIDQALMMIGARGLARWIHLLLFQIGSVGGLRSPLMHVAASRARLMELVALESAAGGGAGAGKDRGEVAFLVGILSLVHVLLGAGRAAAIEGLSVTGEVRAALLEAAGPLGCSLRLVEALEQGAFTEALEMAGELGIDPARIRPLQCEAFEWVRRMTRPD